MSGTFKLGMLGEDRVVFFSEDDPSSFVAPPEELIRLVDTIDPRNAEYRELPLVHESIIYGSTVGYRENPYRIALRCVSSYDALLLEHARITAKQSTFSRREREAIEIVYNKIINLLK